MIESRRPDPVELRTLAVQVRQVLTTRRFGKALRSYDTVGSTNTLAMAWAEEGAAEGSVVMAEYQRSGRGRQGRRWQSTRGLNLLFSVILRPSLLPAELGLVTLAGCLAVADVLRDLVSPVEVLIRWPNDLLLDGKKCCGMLLESAITAHGATAVVLGTGLNVNQEVFADALAPAATSLLLATGRHYSRASLIARILLQLEHHYDAAHSAPEALCNEYARSLHGLGRTLHVKGPPPVTGIVLGVTSTGALRLQTPSGQRLAHTGDALMAETVS